MDNLTWGIQISPYLIFVFELYQHQLDFIISKREKFFVNGNCKKLLEGQRAIDIYSIAYFTNPSNTFMQTKNKISNIS